jgi:hypothetical protein
MQAGVERVRAAGPGFAHLVGLVEEFVHISSVVRPEERYSSFASMLEAVQYAPVGIPLQVAEVAPRVAIRDWNRHPSLDEVDGLARGSRIVNRLAGGSGAFLTAAELLIAGCNSGCFQQTAEGAVLPGHPAPVHPVMSFHRSYPTFDEFVDQHSVHAQADARRFIVELKNGHATVELSPSLFEEVTARVQPVRPKWAAIGCPALHRGLVGRFKHAMLDVARHPMLWEYQLRYLREA